MTGSMWTLPVPTGTTDMPEPDCTIEFASLGDNDWMEHHAVSLLVERGGSFVNAPIGEPFVAYGIVGKWNFRRVPKDPLVYAIVLSGQSPPTVRTPGPSVPEPCNTSAIPCQTSSG